MPHNGAGCFEVGQQVAADRPFGHQTRVGAVLQVHLIIEAKEWIGLWILLRGFFGNQHCNQEPMQIEGEIVIRCDLQNAFVRMTEVFAEPKDVARHEPTTAEQLAHDDGAAMDRDGDKRQSRQALSATLA